MLTGRSPSRSDDDGIFTVRVRTDGSPHVVALSGELDLSSRAEAFRACASNEHVDVVVDLTNLVFMDCAGYGALVESRKVLTARGGSLELIGSVGEPLQLLTLLTPAQPDPRRAAIERWGAALARRDHDEVDRLVRQDRSERTQSARNPEHELVLGPVERRVWGGPERRSASGRRAFD